MYSLSELPKALGINISCQQKVQIVHCILCQYVSIHIIMFCVAQMLLEFLNKVIMEPVNKMTAENVAMVMAPNLFLVSSGSRNRPQPMDRELKLAVATSKITLLLLSNQSRLWTVIFLSHLGIITLKMTPITIDFCLTSQFSFYRTGRCVQLGMQ